LHTVVTPAILTIESTKPLRIRKCTRGAEVVDGHRVTVAVPYLQARAARCETLAHPSGTRAPHRPASGWPARRVGIQPARCRSARTPAVARRRDRCTGS